ncbi:MAG: MraY family glycosyltransferase [Planctomycetota bacterium]|nr:MraY family glycosyltransferase [Planctomycetota bacterium]
MGLAAFYLAAGCMVLSALATMVVKALAKRLAFIDQPRAGHIHTTPTPLGGGLAIFVAVWLPLGAAVGIAILCRFDKRPDWIPEWIFVHFQGVVSKTFELTLLFLASAVMLMLGFLDDVSPMKALPKFLVQVVVATAMVAFGFRASVFVGEATWWGMATCWLVSILWITGITNSLNLLDNADGFAACVTAVVSLVFGLIAFETGQLFIALFLFAILGAVVGFLPFNFPPARIFMGDAGSLFLGFMLSTLTILFTFYDHGSRHLVQTFFTPILVMAVPMYDTASVVLIRLREGRPVFRGDTTHFSHRLAAMGLGGRGALFVSTMLTFFCGLSAMLLYHVSASAAVLVFVQVGAVIALLIALEWAGRKPRE